MPSNITRRDFFGATFGVMGSIYLSGCGPSDSKPSTTNSENIVSISVEDGKRVIVSNSTPKHLTGEFPNPTNPYGLGNEIFRFEMHEVPIEAVTPKSIYERYHRFGIALNGVTFDPAGPAWDGNNIWHVEVLSFTASRHLGVDFNNAHVQPYDRPEGAEEDDGEYHYHGFPEGLFNLIYKENMEKQLNKKMFLLGYAADGYPIYAPDAPQNSYDLDSPTRTLSSSYKLKIGEREDIVGQNKRPAGHYDGTFVEDYEYIESLGDLDAFNGQFGVTPEYPDGTYYYVITKTFPFIPRMFKGEILDNPPPLTAENMNFVHPQAPGVEQIPQALQDYPSA